jgi:CRP-like cAMP-binding protein
MLNLDAYKPLLVHTKRNLIDDAWLVTPVRGGQSVRFTADDINLLDLFDGTQSLADITAQLAQSQKSFSFKRLIHVLCAAQGAGLLDEPPAVAWIEDAGSQTRQSWFQHPWWTRTFIQWGGQGRPQPMALYATAIVLCLGAILTWLNVGPLALQGQFMRPQGHYALGALGAFCSLSLLRLWHGWVWACMGRFATGYWMGLGLQLQPLGFTITSHNGSAGHKSPFIATAMTIGGASASLTLSGLLYFLLPDSLTLELVGLAALYSVFLMNPFVHSDASQILSEQIDATHRLHLIPYLRHKALWSFVSKKPIAGEFQMVLFATYGFAWCFASLGILLALSRSMITHLLADIGLMGATIHPTLSTNASSSLLTMADRVVATCGLAAMAGLLLYGLYRLSSFIISNLTNPLHDHARSFKRQLVSQRINKQNAKLAEALSAVSIFANAQPDFLTKLRELGEFRSYPAGTCIVVQGEQAREAYVLLKGQVAVERIEPSGLKRSLASLEPGVVFGEASLREDKVRSADVRAQKKSLVLVLTPELLQDLEGLYGHESLLRRITLGQYFRSSPLFKKVPPELLDLCARHAQCQEVKVGTVVIEENTPGDTFYGVIRGEVDIKQQGQHLETLGTGSFFGETALLTGHHRNATVTTTQDSTLLSLNRQDFWTMLSKHLQLGLYLEEISIDRASHTGT